MLPSYAVQAVLYCMEPARPHIFIIWRLADLFIVDDLHWDRILVYSLVRFSLYAINNDSGYIHVIVFLFFIIVKVVDISNRSIEDVNNQLYSIIENVMKEIGDKDIGELWTELKTSVDTTVLL